MNRPTKYITDSEKIQFLIKNYSLLGPKTIGVLWNWPMKTVSKKALALGLYRGQKAGNISRSNMWSFSTWSYDLGYIVGVYLGDGNAWVAPNQCAYFRHASIDEEFCKTTAQKLEKVTGYNGSIIYNHSKGQWIYTLCNRSFTEWLIQNFGPANKKKISLLPDMEANKGMLEGIIDSEGTINSSDIVIRMSGNLKILETICNTLGIQHAPQHRGVRNLTWQRTPNFQGYSISNKEYTRMGLGTYIKRKAKFGIIYKGDANDFPTPDLE